MDIDTNYFIKHKYYAPFNIKDIVVTAIKQNSEYKKAEKSSINRTQIIHIKQNSTILTAKNQNNTCYQKTDECLVDLSASEIFNKKEHKEDSISFSEEICLLDQRDMTKKEASHTINNTNNRSDNSSIGGKIIDKKDR
jgi:hypothetical protein